MFDISILKTAASSFLNINEEFSFNEADLKDTEIVRLENIKATGKIERIEESTYKLDLNIKGNMVLLCARSLEEVDYPLNILKKAGVDMTTSTPIEKALDMFDKKLQELKQLI